MNHPLLQDFNTPFQSIPFQEIKQEDLETAILEGIEFAQKEIEQITKNIQSPTFENTIEALEAVGKGLEVVSGILFNLGSAETNAFLDNVQEKIAPILAGYAHDVSTNEELFQKVRIVFDNCKCDKLTKEEYRLLEHTYKSFSRNGVLLSKEDKLKLRQIDQELSLLTVKYAQNILQETNDYALKISAESKLEGLPDSIKFQAKEEAEKRKETGWIFTLQSPSFVPFMKYIKNRALRKELYIAFGKRAYRDNSANNEKNIHKIVDLRQTRATLLGFKTHSDFVLEERMAANPDAVFAFLNDLLDKAKPFALRDVESLKPLASRDGIIEIMPYDHAYYAEQLRTEKFDFSEEELKPYFPLDQVLDAAFNAAHKLYKLEFKRRNDIQTYHEEVTVYEVLEDGNHKALLYTDWHPRQGKRPGAWMTSFKGQYKDKKGNHRPHISIVCNFSRSSAEMPSLLTFQEVATLFHEFGHSLHGILADTVYESISGTNVYWDFVELPSQFMENYCYQKSFLNTFAKHYKTGEVLSEIFIDKIVASSNYMEGYQTLRQLSFGLLDMAYHTGKLDEEERIADFELEKTQKTQLYPRIKGTAQSPAFSHIFAGGYSSGYYSYKWSEVLDADAFSFFMEKGIFDQETASKFKTLLSKGGTEDPMELYVAFRGRKPEINALLQRAGLN